MKLIVIALTAGSLAAPNSAPASETAKPLQLRPKSLVTETVPRTEAPFLTPSGEPELALVPPPEAHPVRRSPCGDGALCYDASAGHLVYKGARRWMPDIPGFQAENISLKRNSIVFRYSFQ